MFKMIEIKILLEVLKNGTYFSSKEKKVEVNLKCLTLLKR